MTDFDPVTKPEHYTSGAIECIDAIRTALGDEGFVAYCRGTVIKYAWRAGKKEKHAEDLRKGAWYMNKAAEVLGEKELTKADDSPPPTMADAVKAAKNVLVGAGWEHFPPATDYVDGCERLRSPKREVEEAEASVAGLACDHHWLVSIIDGARFCRICRAEQNV